MHNYWLNIYKPKGISSAQLVNKIKKVFGKIKIGHAGTLDVEAEGVLPLAIGEATKLVQMLMNARKTYIFTLQFGVQTNSGDFAGKIINTTDFIPNAEETSAICSKFTGIISQIPPQFSALKINGIRSYKLARENIKVDLKPRNITIYSLQCLNYDEKNKTATFIAECSKGTYIRTLAEDIAISLQSLAFVIELRRIRVGPFEEDNSIKIENFEEQKNLKIFLQEKSIKIETILDDILVFDADDEQAKKIKYGQKCYFNYDEDVSFLWIRHQGVLLAIGNLDKNCFNSMRVFNL